MSSPVRVPTRWQATRLRRPPGRLRWMARALGVRIAPEDDDVVCLRDGLRRADPVADAFVEWSGKQSSGRGRELFERAVEEGLFAGAPEPLAQWFEPLEREPAWLDKRALRLACETAWRVGASGGTVLSAMALMGGYRSSAAVKPLAMTGALDKMVVRRIAETSRFTLDVVESKDMGRFSPGFKSACRVRLMHAQVRRSLSLRADWRTDDWGVPINQTDMAATHLEFSAVYLSGLSLLGFRFTPAERDAVMHLWRYVSVVMGVDDDLLAHDYKTGVRHMLIHALTNPYADEDSRALALALHELPGRLAETPAQQWLAQAVMRYRVAVSRFTLGDEAIDDIGLPPEPLTALLPLMSAARFGIETVRMHSARFHERAQRRGLARQRELVGLMVGPKRVSYVPYGDRAATSVAVMP